MQAGWYSDPVGAHDVRYHNGIEWTGDVATNGIRHVSPLPQSGGAPTMPPPSDAPTGTVALVFGVISMTIGWVPFVCFVAIVFAGAAIIIGLRRRRLDSARGAATAGIVTGLVGLAFCAAGIWLSIVLVQAVAAFEDPGPHEVELVSCGEVDGVTRASGTITNLGTAERSYTIEVTFDGERRQTGTVDDVPSGAQRSFDIDENLRFDELDCSIVEVNGPQPFGLQQ